MSTMHSNGNGNGKVQMSKHILYALAIVALGAMLCTTVVGLMAKDTTHAGIILTAIAAIASPLIMGLLNMYKQSVDAQASAQQVEHQTRELKTEVQEAAKVVTKDVTQEAAKVALEVASQRVRDKG